MNMDSDNLFKKGSQYSRKDVGWILLPDTGRPAGGDWDTGYVRIDNKLIIFMNIGVSGTTGHDFDNYYDDTNKTIVWYGKPRSNSQQPTFQKLLSGEYTPYFFARWDNKNPNFTYLGIGKIVSFKDGIKTKDGNENIVDTIELKLTISDSEFIIPNINPEISPESKNNKGVKSSFALEKHLEDFIISNWGITSLSEKYDIYESEGKLAQQFHTRSGPIDILALSKDKKEFLVIELKKGRASDVVVGQITRYMGDIMKNLANDQQNVRGIIIALEDDQNLKDSIYAISNIEFMRYELKFELKK